MLRRPHLVQEEYGRKGGNKKDLPPNYDQNLERDADFTGGHLAKGKWTKKGFYLFKGSRIMQEFLGEGIPGIK